MNLDRLKTLVAGRRASADDHLWLLREDPGYFAETLQEWKEHDVEMLRHECHGCWLLVAERMIGDSLTLFLYWHYIHCRLDQMSSIESQMQRADHSRLRLANQDEQLWVELMVIVQVMRSFPIELLAVGFTPSPRMRHCYTPSKDGYSWNTKLKLTEAERRVNCLFYSMANEELRELHTLNHLVQETQYMLETDEEASQLVDSWVVTVFSDLAMLSELEIRIEGLGMDLTLLLFGNITVANTKPVLHPSPLRESRRLLTLNPF